MNTFRPSASGHHRQAGFVDISSTPQPRGLCVKEKYTNAFALWIFLLTIIGETKCTKGTIPEVLHLHCVTVMSSAL
jgi:hypothetical protein